MESSDIRQAVQQKYGEIASAVKSGEPVSPKRPPVRRSAKREGGSREGGCCGPSCCSTEDPITGNLYKEQTSSLPKEAVTASLGCGNPTALIDLHEGETVLDLGSGGGIDVLLSALRVGATGKVYGLDMTDEMLDLARDNQRKAGVGNVEFLKGDIQAIPLPSSSVDVVISNCVINLAPDKSRVLAEAFRVLKPGGRFAVSDVIVRGEVPPAVRRDMELWVGCLAGALDEADYKEKLTAAGFTDVHVDTWRIYDRLRQGSGESRRSAFGAEAEGGVAEADGGFASAFIGGRKP